MRIAVVSICYAPDSTGIAPYSADLCEVLTSSGANVRALVGVPHYPSWQVHADYRSSKVFHEIREGVELTRVRHYVPSSASVARRARYEASFSIAGLRATRDWRPDVALAVTPNLGAVVIADRMTRHGAALGVVVQDLVGAAACQSGAGMDRISGRMLSALEARLLRRADGIAVVTPEFAHRLVRAGVDPERVRDLPNYARIAASELSKEQARRLLGWPTDRVLAVHTGNIGQKQNMEVVVEAARLAADGGDDIEFVLVGDGNQRARIAELSAGLRNLRLVPPVSAEDYPLTLAAADCLILNERDTVVDMSRPSKLTSYFSAGRPVIAATMSQSASAEEIRRSGAGVVVQAGDPAALLAGVITHAHGPASLEMGLAGRHYAATNLSRESAKKRMISFVQDLAKDGSRRSSLAEAGGYCGALAPRGKIQANGTSLSLCP